MKVLAIDRNDGWAFVREGDRILLLRPPYRPESAPIATSAAVTRAVLHHGYTSFDREVASWDEVAALARAEVAARCREEGRPLPAEGVGREMLRVAPVVIVERFLDRVRAELLPRGDLDAAEKILDALEAESPRLRASAALTQRAADLRREVERARATRVQRLAMTEPTDELVERWRARADWAPDELAAWLESAPVIADPNEEHWYAAGYALARAIDDLAGLNGARAKSATRQLIARLYRRHGHDDPYERARGVADPYDGVLIQQAHAHRWAPWAVDCLPSLCFVVEAGESLRILALREYVKRMGCKIEAELCGGNVVEASAHRSLAELIKVIAEVVEPARLQNPYTSPGSSPGALADKLEELLVSLKANNLTPLGYDAQTLLSSHLTHQRSRSPFGAPLPAALADPILYSLPDTAPHSMRSGNLSPLAAVASRMQENLRGRRTMDD